MATAAGTVLPTGQTLYTVRMPYLPVPMHFQNALRIALQAARVVRVAAGMLVTVAMAVAVFCMVMLYLLSALRRVVVGEHSQLGA